MFTPPPKNEVSKLAASAAADILGLPALDGLTKDAVKTAFRKAAIKAHPDTLDPRDPIGDAERLNVAQETIALAQEARDVLFAWIDSLPDEACPYCKGKGFVRTGAMTVKPCNHC